MGGAAALNPQICEQRPSWESLLCLQPMGSRLIWERGAKEGCCFRAGRGTSVRQARRAQRLTFWVQRPSGGVGVFHAKGWWPRSSPPPSKVCFPWNFARMSLTCGGVHKSGKKKAHKHNFCWSFCPWDDLGIVTGKPTLSQGQTQVFSLFYTREAQLVPGKPSLSLGHSRG